MILHYFPECLTPMLTLGPRSYRSPNLELVLQMWENLESNLLVWLDKQDLKRKTNNHATLKKTGFFFYYSGVLVPLFFLKLNLFQISFQSSTYA
jgi:hypothetical protein